MLSVKYDSVIINLYILLVMKKLKSFFSGNLFLLLMSLTCVLYSCQSENAPSNTDGASIQGQENMLDSSKKSDYFVKAPCNGMDIPYESFNVNSEIGGELNCSSGSKLVIKSNSFVDVDGNQVNGDVTILYRELHNPVDFFLSGIPMSYDTLGQKKYFESAGMLDILAFKEGKPVYLNPQKKINIEMKSQYEGTDYNVYYLDTIEKKWQYVSKDRVITKSEKLLKSENKSQSQNIPDNTLAPKLANKSKHRFNMDVNLNQFPELSSYKGVMFEVSDMNDGFDPKLYDVNWDNAVLSESNIKGNYNLKLFKEDTSFNFIVYPVFEGSNYEKAMLDFKSKMKNYSDQLKNKKPELPAVNKPTAINTEFADFMPENKTVKDIKRAFEINKFGVWNCDKFVDMPHGEDVIGEYADLDGKKLDFVSLFFVDKSKNALFDINPSKKWTFNKKSENLLWGVLRDNRVAVFSPSQFRKLKRNEGRCYFSMSASDNVSGLKEIKRFIGL